MRRMPPRSSAGSRRPPAARAAGFSLIELVLVMVLLGSIAGMLAVPMASLVESQRLLATESIEKTDVDYTLGRISAAVRAASEVTICNATTLQLTLNGTPVSFSRAGTVILLDDTETLLTGVGAETIMCDDTYAGVLDIYRVAIAVDGQTYRVGAFRRLPAG